MVDTGVVDQHVQLAELLDHGVDHPRAGIRIGQVTGDGPVPGAGQAVPNPLGGGTVPAGMHRDPMTGRRQSRRDRRADASTRSGNQAMHVDDATALAASPGMTQWAA